jgi:hypothetical protein
VFFPPTHAGPRLPLVRTRLSHFKKMTPGRRPVRPSAKLRSEHPGRQSRFPRGRVGNGQRRDLARSADGPKTKRRPCSDHRSSVGPPRNGPRRSSLSAGPTLRILTIRVSACTAMPVDPTGRGRALRPCAKIKRGGVEAPMVVSGAAAMPPARERELRCSIWEGQDRPGARAEIRTSRR